MRTLALGRIGQPAQELGERRLARTRLADDRDVRAGRDVDAHVVQHRRVAAVGEPDVRHLDGERAVREMHAVGRLDDVDRHVEHREHLAPAGDGGLGLVEDLAQLGDRDQQQVDEEHERDDLADVEAPARCRSTRRRHDDRGERRWRRRGRRAGTSRRSTSRRAPARGTRRRCARAVATRARSCSP